MAASSIYSYSSPATSTRDLPSSPESLKIFRDKIIAKIKTDDLCQIEGYIFDAKNFIDGIQNLQVRSEALGIMAECLVSFGLYENAKEFLNCIPDSVKFSHVREETMSEFIKSNAIINCTYKAVNLRDRSRAHDFVEMLPPADNIRKYLNSDIDAYFDKFKEYDFKSLQALGFENALKNAIQTVNDKRFSRVTMPGNLRDLPAVFARYNSPDKLREFADTLVEVRERAYAFSIVAAIYKQIHAQTSELKKALKLAHSVSVAYGNANILISIQKMLESPATLVFDDLLEALKKLDDDDQKVKVINNALTCLTLLGFVGQAIRFVSSLYENRTAVRNGSKRQMTEDSTEQRSSAYFCMCRALLSLGDLEWATKYSNEISLKSEKEKFSKTFETVKSHLAAMGSSGSATYEPLLFASKDYMDPYFEEYPIDRELIFAQLLSQKSSQSMLKIAYTFEDKLSRMYAFGLIHETIIGYYKSKGLKLENF